jgi:hypothetical protein
MGRVSASAKQKSRIKKRASTMIENPYVCCTVTKNYLVEYNQYEYFDNDSKHQYVDFIYDDKDKPKLSLCMKTGHCIEDRDIFDDDKFNKQYTLTKDQMRSFLLDHKQFVCDMIDEFDELLNWITEDEYQHIYEQQKEQAQ